ncbi:Uu.00g050000.m01.CDS01 [Anthostomella pinea]|uniref:Uu.00g050000.m01.CDS01 n=1 Tax=Anthostomella pinea TaxID=933095 RepID=A0AAI8VCJ7_9PEZI|nr:Uu.00g050000.m01.CDS01 [Anthostomella pinea]
MALFNPLQFLVFPFVFLIALPLALCAGFTTILAFLVLFLRLFAVYFDIGLETLHLMIVGHSAQHRYIASRRNSPSHPVAGPYSGDTLPPSSSAGSSPASSSGGSSSRYRQHRRNNKRQGSASVPITPGVGAPGVYARPSSAGLDRDFEGLGGWRLDSVDVDADAAEYNLNSRLEIPDRRHHFRTQSGPGAVLAGGTTGVGLYAKAGTRSNAHSPVGLRMTTSPNSARSRTPTTTKPPTFTRVDHDGYFPPYEGKTLKKKVSG